MPILKLVIIPTKVLTDGRHKIRISIAHNSKTRYIPTDCIIDNLSQFKDGQVVNKEDCSYLNMKLRNQLNHYQKVIDSIFDVDIYSCSELRTILLQKKDYSNASYMQAANEYIEELSEEKREKSEKLYRLASKSFVKYEGEIMLVAITPKNIRHFEMQLDAKGLSSTTIKIYLTLAKVMDHTEILRGFD